MNVIIVSGMLGVGKTSTVLKLIEGLISRGVKVAVIENDIGAKGVDGDIIRNNGMEVQELKGGCICCTMKIGMVDTLKYLEANYKPDVVIVEPSGIADPQYIIDVTDEITGVDVASVSTVIVTDAERFMKMKMAFERPLRNQLNVADVVLINKIDTVTAEEADEIEKAIREFAYTGKILRTQAESGENMDKILDVIS